MFGEGIDYNHGEFEGRAFDGGFKWLARSKQPNDCSSKFFGTHVASLAVGKSVGVATKANVYRYEFLIHYIFPCTHIHMLTCIQVL